MTSNNSEASRSGGNILADMDLGEDPRPKNSPYASKTCAVLFRDGKALHIPRDLLKQVGQSPGHLIETPRLQAHFSNISSATGHVVFHFLVCGAYQCLRPQGDSIEEKHASEFKTALDVYVAADSLQLPRLRDLARREITRMGDTLSLPAVISAIEDSDLSFKTLPGVIAYVESRILSFGEGATPAAIEAILSELEGPNTLSRALLRSIVLLKSSELSKQQQSPYGNEGQVFSRTAESVTGEKMRERLLSPTEQAMKEAETKAETSSKLQAEKQMTHETMERLVFPSVEKAYCEEMKSYPTEEPRHAEEPCPAEESWSFCEEVARLDMKEIEALHAKKKRRNGRLIKKDRERLALLIDRVQTRSLTQAELAGAEAAEVASHGKNTTAPAPLPALDDPV